MKATVAAAVAVASSSTSANNNNNRTINTHLPITNPVSASPQSPVWPTTPSGLNVPGIPQIQPNNSKPIVQMNQNKDRSPHANNKEVMSNNTGLLLPPGLHRNSDQISSPNVQNSTSLPYQQNVLYPKNKPKKQNVIYQQSNMQNPQSSQNPQRVQNRQNPQPRNSKNMPKNTQNYNGAQNSNNAGAHSSLQNAPSLQNAHNSEDVENIPEPPHNRILVTGYPSYTQPHDLLNVFTKFGNVRIDRCNSWSATLTYASERQVTSAIEAAHRLHIYGHFLSVKPCSTNLNTDDIPRSPKRDFSKTKQKCVIVEPTKIDLSGDFQTQLDLIMATIRLNQDEINKISTLYRDLENTFNSQWPGCRAIPFGSITTGLGIKTSDADCFISLPVQFRAGQSNHVNKARRLLMQQPEVFAEILAIPRANTPIVKFYHVPTDTNCDLTFKTPLGAQNSRLITFLLQADPRITPMAVIIKYWAKVHELSGTGKLTNYALTLLIIFYLQQPPQSMLPSVEWLQRDRANDFYVDYWNTGFMGNTRFLPQTYNRFTISELIGGFFEFYSLFNFEEMVVCPFLGMPIKKEAFRDTINLPIELDLYKKNVCNGLVMPIRYQTSFCVQDPFEQCHNVASTITSKLALDIRTYFKFVANAYEKEKPNNCVGFLKTMLLEKPKLIRGKTHLEYRVTLFSRIINTIISSDWKPVVRELVMIIFEQMMKIKLGKVEEKMNPDTRKEKEKYMGSLTKPIWKRKKYTTEMKFAPKLGIEEKQSLISEELIKKEVLIISLQIQVIVTFCHDPKSAIVAVRMSGGDIDAFRDFGKFYISVMQNWFTQLLKPYSMPNCKNTAAKIAEAADKETELKDIDSDDDDDEEDNDHQICSSLSPTGDNEVVDETNCSDEIINASNDYAQDGGPHVR